MKGASLLCTPSTHTHTHRASEGKRQMGLFLWPGPADSCPGYRVLRLGCVCVCVMGGAGRRSKVRHSLEGRIEAHANLHGRVQSAHVWRGGGSDLLLALM